MGKKKVETPIVETPVVEAPIVETPVVEAPIVETPVVEAPVEETPVEEKKSKSKKNSEPLIYAGKKIIKTESVVIDGGVTKTRVKLLTAEDGDVIQIPE